MPVDEDLSPDLAQAGYLLDSDGDDSEFGWLRSSLQTEQLVMPEPVTGPPVENSTEPDHQRFRLRICCRCSTDLTSRTEPTIFHLRPGTVVCPSCHTLHLAVKSVLKKSLLTTLTVSIVLLVLGIIELICSTLLDPRPHMSPSVPAPHIDTNQPPSWFKGVALFGGWSAIASAAVFFIRVVFLANILVSAPSPNYVWEDEI